MTRDQWTHRVCQSCYATRDEAWAKIPAGERVDLGEIGGKMQWLSGPGEFLREPVRLNSDPGGPCCYCGKINYDGIFVRDNPAEVAHP